MARTLRAAPSELRIAIRFLAGAPRLAIKRLKLTVGPARKRAALPQLIRTSVIPNVQTLLELTPLPGRPGIDILYVIR